VLQHSLRLASLSASAEFCRARLPDNQVMPIGADIP
jgi:hypothetical protein